MAGYRTRIAFIRFAQVVDTEMKPLVAAVIGKIATDAADWAAVNAPYEYGNLSASVQAARASILQWRINVGQDYGIHQEFGTRYMAAQPFLVPSVMGHRGPFHDALKAVLR